MNWGKWIFVSFVLFAAFIAVLVTVCLRQDVNLVSEGYYKDELAYQDQIERIHNARELLHKPVITVVEQKFVKVEFDQFRSIEKGELNLFCPSNPRFDKRFEVKTSNESQQLFPLNNSPTGMYRVKLLWTMDGKEFYMEEIIGI